MKRLVVWVSVVRMLLTHGWIYGLPSSMSPRSANNVPISEFRHGSVGWLHGAAFALGLMHLYAGMSLEHEGLDASEVADCRDRDRFKVVRIPSPGFEHIGVLSERIIEDLAKSRGLDRRWIEPLAQDEQDLVRKAWTGGSLRKLSRIVTMIVDGRESQMGRA